MQQVRSNFVTVPGLVILLLVSLIAAYLGIGLLFTALLAFFLLCLCSRLWTDLSLKKMEVSSEVSDLRTFPGETLDVPVSVYNGKALPLIWLSAEMDLPENACIEPSGDGGAVFSWIMPFQRLSWSDPVKALRRGICTVSRMKASSGDGFGLAGMSDVFSPGCPLEIVVYPKLIDVNVSLILKKLTEFEISKNGFYTDPTLIKSTRDYMPSDSIRDLNWRLLARQGAMVVNVREKLEALRICVLLDIESFSEEMQPEPPSTAVTYRLMEDDFEDMLSLAASVIERAASAGAVCSLVVPAFKDHDAEIVIPDDRSLQTDILLKAIAGIEYKGGPAQMPFDLIETQQHSLGQVFCFTGSAADLQKRSGFEELPGMWFVSSGAEALEHVIDKAELLL